MSDKPLDYLNSWEHVEELRETLTTRVNGRIHSLNDVWERSYKKTVPDRVIDKDAYANPHEAFMVMIDKGIYPPPEIMIAIHSCFKAYAMTGNQQELEHYFFGPKRKSVGNHAASVMNDFNIEDFHLWLSDEGDLEEIKRDGLIQKKIEEYLDIRGLYDTNVKTFLTACRRWRKRTGRYAVLNSNQGDN